MRRHETFDGLNRDISHVMLCH